MTEEHGPHYTLLDELDARQDQVLAELDALNARIQRLLKQYTQPQRSEPPAPPVDRAA